MKTKDDYNKEIALALRKAAEIFENKNFFDNGSVVYGSFSNSDKKSIPYVHLQVAGIEIGVRHSEFFSLQETDTYNYADMPMVTISCEKGENSQSVWAEVDKKDLVINTHDIIILPNNNRCLVLGFNIDESKMLITPISSGHNIPELNNVPVGIISVNH